MTSKSIKILATIAIAVAGVVLLAVQSIGSVEYYVHVEQIYDNPPKWLEKKTISVHGFAHKVPREGTVNQQSITREFDLESQGKTIHVRHDGVVPDTFKEEAETVVTGQLSQRGDGAYLLTTVGGEKGIMAKCPSKYNGASKP